MENVLAMNSPSSEESRSFQVHQNLLFHLIHNQGQSEVEAIRELVQNSMDAQASYCKIWLTSKGFCVEDDGIGFQSREAIIRTFEIFGQPHEPEEKESSFKLFRIGRGQIMAFARTVWYSGLYSMSVDIEKNGFTYKLTENAPNEYTKGCRIVGEWNKPSNSLEENLHTFLMGAVGLVTSMAIYINDKRINFPDFGVAPDFESEDFYFFRTTTLRDGVQKIESEIVEQLGNAFDKSHYTDYDEYYTVRTQLIESFSPATKSLLLLDALRYDGKLRVFNLGVWVVDVDAIKGTEGLIVTKKALTLTTNRNALHQKCPIWSRINTDLLAWQRNILPGYRLTDYEKEAMLVDAVKYPQYYLTKEFFEQPFFSCGYNQSHYSLESLLMVTKPVTIYQSDLHRLSQADRMRDSQKAIVLWAEDYEHILSKIGHRKFSTFFFKLLKGLASQATHQLAKQDPSNKEWFTAEKLTKLNALIDRFIELPQLINQLEKDKILIEDPALTVYQFAALRALDDVVGNGKGCTSFSISKAIYRAVVMGDKSMRTEEEWGIVKKNWQRTLRRLIRAGWCPTAAAWTDSFTYIAFHVEELDKLQRGLIGAQRLLLLYYHELAHHPLNSEAHNLEFYETFHRLVLSENCDLLVKPAFTLLRRFAYYLHTQQINLPINVKEELLSEHLDRRNVNQQIPAARRWHAPMTLLAQGRIAPLWFKTDPELHNRYLAVWNDDKGISYLIPKCEKQKPLRLAQFIQGKTHLEAYYTSKVYRAASEKEARSFADVWLAKSYARRKKAVLVCIVTITKFLGEIRLCPRPSGKPLQVL